MVRATNQNNQNQDGQNTQNTIHNFFRKSGPTLTRQDEWRAGKHDRILNPATDNYIKYGANATASTPGNKLSPDGFRTQENQGIVTTTKTSVML